jgi:hypothetical protein
LTLLAAAEAVGCISSWLPGLVYALRIALVVRHDFLGRSIGYGHEGPEQRRRHAIEPALQCREGRLRRHLRRASCSYTNSC